ncbi:tetratricopeptide repeat protein [Candidatus Haliotispira prima]|uniref:Tetratricopeptide repeat protein n=1 Tax=Candidatus Haliotispira prima TaxID=3034016 RepID=A0ABY8MK47_9SPIO|nr:tetratricopeptide repeat protein [Candidatus Haliotispira prima]
MEKTPGNGEVTEHITHQLSKLGYQSIKAGKYVEAEASFREILSYDETNNYAMVGLGDALRRQHRDKEAIEYYRNCLELYPENNYALFGIAESYRALKYYQKAIEAWVCYTQIDSKNITVMTRMADIYRKMKNLKRSKEVYEQVLEIDTENIYAIIGLAHVYYDLYLYNISLNYWERILNKQNARVDIRVLTSVGNCYRKLRDFSKSLEFFRKAEKLEAKNFYVLYGIADSYRGLQNFTEAMHYWDLIIAEGHDNQFVLTRAGDTASASGQHDQAKVFYQRVLDMGPDLYATLGLARLEHEGGDHDRSIDLLESLLENHYRNPRLQIGLAMSYCAKNQTKKAFKNLDVYIHQGYGNEEVMALHQNLKESLGHNHD